MAKSRLKLEKFESKEFTVEGLDLSIGEILDETADWEPLGPTPFPGMIELRDWDFRLMKRYRPQYYPACESCCFCGYGKCDLQEGKEGACGIKLHEQVARKNFMRATWGLAAHAGHARHMLHELIDMHGPDLPLDMGSYVDVEAPNIRTVCGIKPKTLADLREVLDYVEEEFLQMVSALHTGQEGNNLDFESKALNAGMLDHVAMEAADIAQIASYDMPRGDPEAPLVDIGMGTLDPEKPCVLCYGHNLVAAADVIKYIEENDLWDEVEVGGICCTALDMTRTDQNVNVVGGLSSALKFIRTGVADVVVTDEQCIRTDTFEEATAVGSKVIATSEKVCYGLQDRTNDSVDEIVEDLVDSQDGVLIVDLEKVGEVATKVAQRISPKRRDLEVLPTDDELKDMVSKCTLPCVEACPTGAIQVENGELKRDMDLCVTCPWCEDACPNDAIKVTKLMDGEIELDPSKCPGGCAVCLEICPVDAIYEPEAKEPWEKADKIAVDERYCIYCGACVNACPVDAIKIDRREIQVEEVESLIWDRSKDKLLGEIKRVEQKEVGNLFEGRFMEKVSEIDTFLTNVSLYFDEDSCVGCGICEAVCPKDAIKLGPTGAVAKRATEFPSLTVDEEKCSLCGVCDAICPFEAFRLETDGERTVPIVELEGFPRLVKNVGLDNKKCKPECKRSCRRNCPNDYPLDEAMASAQDGDYSKLSHIFTELCLGCGRCEEKCPQDIEIFQVMEKAAEKDVKEEKYKMRVGRGPIRDTEIRKVGSPIVLGEIPGVIALVGCPNYPGSKEPIYRVAKELASRNYIIAASGCQAMDMSFYTDDEGKTIWEQFPGDFDGGGVCNVGSCVSNSHITGAAIKIANIFAKIPLRANYKEIADYILNRVGACGISWGAYSQKAVSIANGVQRLGIPVILGPRSSLYGRSMLGRQDREEDWIVRNKRNLEEEGLISPGPEHLCYYAESPEEMIVKAVKFCIRPNDTDVGRQIKLSHYIDLYNKYFDEKYPPDLYMYIRRDRDVPIKARTEVMEMLKEDERWEKGKFGIDQPTILREGEFE